MTDNYIADCVEFLQKLIRIPSVNGKDNEAEVAELIVLQAQHLGLPVRVIEDEPGRPNVFVGDGFDSPEGLLLVAHSDTVPSGSEDAWQFGAFSGETVDGRIYGRGAVDCKGGVAIGLYALKLLHDSDQGHLAKFLTCVDEESGADSQFGIRAALCQGLRAKGAAYLYCASDDNEFIIGHRGVLRLWVTCEGKSIHSGSYEWQERLQGESAIDGMIMFLAELQNFTTEIVSGSANEFFPQYKTVITPTLLSGGEAESIVPGSAKVLLDIRTLPGDNDQMLAAVRQLADRLTTNHRRFDVTIKNNIPAAVSDPDAPIVREMLTLVTERLGVIDPVLRGSGPANEAHMLIEAGIPTIVGFGPRGGNYHSPNEYAELDSVKPALEFLVLLAQRLAQSQP